MKKRFIATLLMPALVGLVADQAFARNARVRTSCYIDPQGQIQGFNPDKMTEIASVSKVLVTHWVIAQRGPEAKIKTLIHVTRNAQGSNDVHIQGGLDPSFNETRLSVVAAHLNAIGVTNISKMTFDENFRYLPAVYSGGQVAGTPELHIRVGESLTSLVRSTITNISSIYATTRIKQTNLDKSDLPATVSLKVADIRFVSSANFKKTAETATYKTESIPVHEMIKQMNNKSNNYIANILFDYMGGKEAYKTFVSNSLGFDSKQLLINNGSGNPIRNAQGRLDNKATCRAIVSIVKDLRNKMMEKNMRLADVMAVAGADGSTLDGVYATDLMENALIAKTGTINPVVALAGLASTVKGNVYFAVVVADGSPGRGSSGRVIIRQEVEGMFQQYGGSDEIEYQADAFLAVDDSAKLQKQDNQVLN